ncbi:hypothetical protein KUL49_28830 [Alteromonas sp. KUL49]|nr:hypothetical protein KUL49_28830 [Alteromonas sp. KUL49]
MNKSLFKSTFIWLLIFAVIYLLADLVFFRGYLIETKNGVIAETYSSIPKPSGAGPLVHYATVRLDNGMFLKVVCEPRCYVGSEVKVSSYKPLLGGNLNYYATGT